LCLQGDTEIINQKEMGFVEKRRRKCDACGESFPTTEMMDPRTIKELDERKKRGE
jgi:transcriptional regulator NrdR family protein